MVTRKKSPGMRPAFTLIELLVVVSIIALLVSILLPALGRARQQAQMVVCGTHVRQLVIACHYYADDNNEFLPGTASNSQGSMNTTWAGINRFYGPPLMAKLEYIPPEMIHSVQDKTRTYEKACQPEDGAYGWLDTPYDASAHPYIINSSYTFRRYDDPERGYLDTQSVNENAGAYVRPFKRDNIKSFVSDRFTNHYVWSFHGGVEEKSWEANYGNGEGWHVGYVDGYVTLQQNDASIYTFEHPTRAAGGWANQTRNWSYWDENP